MNHSEEIIVHHECHTIQDRIAYGVVKVLRFFADTFFAKRYGHRAVVLETIAAVPGMVGGALLHLRSLRHMKDDHGWIQTMLDEAENERMHLMTFIKISKPTGFERFLVISAQSIFYAAYFLIYVLSSKTAHRIVGYLEEEAVISYTRYLECIENGEVENIAAPDIAIEYWKLPKEARLSDVIIAIRNDEINHREVNHCMANKLCGECCTPHFSKSAPAHHTEAYEKYTQRPSPEH